METVPIQVPVAGRIATVKVPADQWNAYTPEQQEQAIRQWKTKLAGQELVAAQDAITMGEPGGFLDSASTTMNEFARNFTGGLDAYAGAAASYLPTFGSGPDPFDGLGFLERRDAIRAAQDIREERIPGWLNNTASVLGVVGLGSGPAAKGIGGMGDALAAGGAVGTIEGIGNSQATDLEGLIGDGAIGAGAGAVAGGTAEFLLDKVAGGGVRRIFAKPGDESGVAYHAQQSLGIPPSIGSVGNRAAASLENSMAQSPVAPITAVLPGRSALTLQNQQRELLDSALQREITDRMRPPGFTPNRAPDEINTSARLMAETTGRRLMDEVQQMEGQYERLVPPGTPVNIAQTRQFPENLRAADTAESIAVRADQDLAAINRNRMTPVDATLHGQLTRQQGTLEGRIAQKEAQLRNVIQNNGSPVQIRNLERSIAKDQRDLGDVQQKIYDNMGPAFKAYRQERNLVGKDTQRGGLMGGEAKMLYGSMTEDLAAAAERVRPGAGAEFLRMTSRESEIYDAKAVVDKIAARPANYNELKNAARTGKWEEIDVLLSKATPEETLAFQADLIDLLGRNARNEFDPGTFQTNWFNMSDTAKQRLFAQNPDGLAVAETLAEVVKDFTARARMDNHSNTAAQSGLMAFLGAAVASPGKVVTFLTVALGLDRTVASEALAKAVAGERTDLGELIRRVAINYAGTIDPETQRPRGPQ